MSKLEMYKEWINVEPIHCHKKEKKNTLVEKLRIVSADKRHCEVLMKFNVDELGFFFDHEIDHYPGMLEVCALRQCSLALAHLVYDVPITYITVLDWIKVKLYNFGELNTETIVKATLLEKKIDRYKSTFLLEGLMCQNGDPNIKMSGKLIAMSPKLAQKIRHRKSPMERIERSPDEKTSDC